jgi:hypothetical protein
MNKAIGLAFLLVCLQCTQVRGADSNDQFSIRGAGLLTCEAYMAERKAQSPAYLMIGGWLDGYVTGVNQYARDTFDAVPFQSAELLLLIVSRHCQNNPKDRLFAVVNSLLHRMENDRLTVSSPMVAVRVGEYQTALYVEVIRRMQVALARSGFLSGQANGQWTQETEAGLASYQKASNLEATGYPDQTTLWKLLAAESAN